MGQAKSSDLGEPGEETPTAAATVKQFEDGPGKIEHMEAQLRELQQSMHSLGSHAVMAQGQRRAGQQLIKTMEL